MRRVSNLTDSWLADRLLAWAWMRGAITPLLLAVLAACGTRAPAIIAPGGSGSLEAPSIGEELWAARLLELTNEFRASQHLPPLELAEDACVVAYEHAWDMDGRAYFSHVNPDGEGPRERFARHGIPAEWVGENLARGQATPEEVLQAWIDSPDHLANLIYPGWTRVGLAVHSRRGAGPWWAADYFAGE